MDAVREQLWLVKTLVFPILEQIWLDKIDLSPSLTTSSLFKINLPHLSNVIFQTLSNEHGIIHDSASHIPLKNETLQTFKFLYHVNHSIWKWFKRIGYSLGGGV